MDKVKKTKLTWSKMDEIDLINRLGEWRYPRPCQYTHPQLLRLYIEAHKNSPHSHHKAGVIHAQDRLRTVL